MSGPDPRALPRDAAGGPVFPGQWQARAFALAVELDAAGVVAWADFSAALSVALTREDDYWRAWAQALTAVIDTAGIASPARVGEVADLWEQAAERTPHGQPVRLESAGGGAEAPGLRERGRRG